MRAPAEDSTRAHQRWIRWFAATTSGARIFARGLHRLDRIAFRLSGGRRTLTAALSGLPVIMLTTTGARIGLPRTVPVLGFPIQDDVAVAAGNFGRAQDPAWCLNLRRDPHARIVVDGHIRRVVADELAGDAREAVWQQCLAIYPGGTAYATRASARTIAVFLLRADSSKFDGPFTPHSATFEDTPAPRQFPPLQ
ncbi:MAG TPA: nitroreductase family deazaflavin-dependent oxidoreductase [Actinomycetes bacterium]